MQHLAEEGYLALYIEAYARFDFMMRANGEMFCLEDNNNFVIRPSGTEPKIKLYCLIAGKTETEAKEIEAEFKKDIERIVS